MTTFQQVKDASDSALRIAIAASHGFAGVPVHQKWKVGHNGVKYWRSVTPVEIIDELRDDSFSSGMRARWLRMPNGKPFVVERSYAGDINGIPTYRNKPVCQEFSISEWPESAYGWQFQTEPWPDVSYSLEPFVDHLPPYTKCLNAMREVIMHQCRSHKLCLDDYVSNLARVLRVPNVSLALYIPEARQVAEAYAITMKLPIK